MCPESLKTHDAVPLFHFAGIRLFRQAFPISVHDLHRRQRRLGSAGALLSCGALRCTGRLCLPSRQAELQPLVPFASTVSGAVHQFQKALDPDVGILVDLRICPETAQPFPMPRPQSTVCGRYPGARSIRPDRRTHRGLACDSFSAEGHWSPDRKHGLLPYNSFLPRGQYLYIKSASKAADTQ